MNDAEKAAWLQIQARTRAAKEKHSARNTKEYRAWVAMRVRCYNPGGKDYASYGGRGLRVCDEWLYSYLSFYAYIGPAPTPDHQIDRINNDVGYQPGNVRWATRSQQQRNRRMTYKWIIDGRHYESAKQAADAHGVTIQSVIRWTDGAIDPRRNSYTPPKAGCFRELRYGQ